MLLRSPLASLIVIFLTYAPPSSTILEMALPKAGSRALSVTF
jgi:hypothetical protein